MIRWAATRPAVIWAAVACVLLAGTISFTKLALATKTTVDLPRLIVTSSWPGASAELVESYITSPTEAVIQGVRGVKKTSSTSQDGGARLDVQLEPNANVQFARLAILERLELLRADFPPGASATRVGNYVPQELQEPPLMRVVLTGPYTPGALKKIADEIVNPRMTGVPGVSSVQVSGGPGFGASVSYDASLLRQLDIAPAAITAAVAESRDVTSLGVERFGATTRAVVMRDQPSALEQLNALPVRGRGGRVFRLGQLATVRPEEDARGQFYRINGNPALAFELIRSAGADAIETAATARKSLAQLQPSLPAGVKFTVQSDDSESLAKELKDLVTRGAIAFVAVVLVLALALRNVRAVALVMGSAAVSIAGTALGLFLMKIPANMLTLAGLGMGIGILVQNGIVVVERLRAAADTADARAAIGERMTPAVLGATLTTSVVLFPFLYLQGNARAAFVPFAAAFVLALAWSVVASLVMIPALASGHGQKARRTRTHHLYGAVLKRLVRWRWATLLVSVAALGVLTWGFTRKVRRFSWGGFGNEKTILGVGINFPRGSDPESLDLAMREMEAIAVGREGVQDVVAQSGSYFGAQMRVTFSDEGAFTTMPMQLQEELTQRAVFIGGASISVRGQGPGFSSGFGSVSMSNFAIKVLGYSFDGVQRLAEDLKSRLERVPRVRDVKISASTGFGSDRAFTVTIDPDRRALARFGVTSADLAAAVTREVAGSSGGQTLDIGGGEILVTVKAKGARERSLDEVRAAIVPTVDRSPVKIEDLATVSERETLNAISREDQQYVRMVRYEFRGPQKLADRTHTVFLASTSVPVGYSVADASLNYGVRDNSEKRLWLVFAIGLALVILSVAMVFDSAWASWMVFLSIPIALGGVIAAFWLADAVFTREAAVGVILVVGHGVNQAILLIDAALVRRRARQGEKGGNGRRQGWLTGAQSFRAAMERSGMIALVTVTTLASLLPLAIGAPTTSAFGAIALAATGGMIAGTIGAMFVIPAMLVGRKGPVSSSVQPRTPFSRPY
jgi:HAE1 family hydrophobic/amphiphilic exporter-1